MTGPAKNATAQIGIYKIRAEAHRIAANDTAKRIEVSRNASVRSVVKINEVIKKLLDLLRQLDQFETIDEEALQKLERIEKSDAAVADAIAKQFGALEATQIVIKKSIRLYRLDLEMLKKQIAGARAIYESMPDVCLKVPPAVEGTP